MKNITTSWVKAAPYFLSTLRIVAAFMFMQSGTVKLFAWPMPMPGGMQIDLLSQAGIGGILEFGGGLMLLFGIFTRPVAFVLAGEMAVAYFQFHQPQALWPMLNNGTTAVLYCFIWLYISAAGAGPLSIDALLNKNKNN